MFDYGIKQIRGHCGIFRIRANNSYRLHTTRITRRCLLDLSDKVVGRTFTQQKPSSMIQVINSYQSRHLCGTLKEIRKVLTG
jgi:hypothetical protein